MEMKTNMIGKAEGMHGIKEKLDHFWYYYKTPALIAAVVILIVIETLITTPKTEKYDLSVAVVSPSGYSEESVGKLRDALETELRRSVEVRLFRLDLGELNQDETDLALLDIDLRNRISEILLLDDVEKFEQATDNLSIYEPVRVGDVEYLSGLGFDELWMVSRN